MIVQDVVLHLIVVAEDEIAVRAGVRRDGHDSIIATVGSFHQGRSDRNIRRAFEVQLLVFATTSDSHTTGHPTERFVQLGLDTFGDVTVGADGLQLSDAEVIRNVVDEAVLADRLGLDFFGVGEHHRDDFAISSPETVLAAIASRTEHIHLGSAVTVLSSDDPIRVYQRFATLDALSNGRAEVILGRGSFTESFPLFGFPLDQYERLFEEKLDLFAQLRSEGPITWSGTTRADVPGLRVYPRTEGGAPHDVGRRGREPGIGRPRGSTRVAADARDHRWGPVALPTVRRPVPASPRRTRPTPAPGRHPLPWPRCRHRRASARRTLAALEADA